MAAIVTVNDALREALAAALENSGLGMTSPELGLSYQVVADLVSGTRNRFRVERVATLALNLGLTPEQAESASSLPVAAEMRRIQQRQTRANQRDSSYTDAIRRAMGQDDG